MNLVVMPLLFLSSAFFPVVQNEPLKTISLVNPLFYMVDGLRGSLTGMNQVLDPFVDLTVVSMICVSTLFLGAHLFNKSEL